MSKKTYTSIPQNYPVCMHSDCPLAATCLHQTSYTALLKRDDYLHLINPSHCSKDESCTYYRNNAPVTYACGFVNFQKKMFPEQYQTFKTLLISRFGRNPYFERRNGSTALSPAEQQIVLDALKQSGVTEPMDFDSYEENINWYD